MAFGLFAHDQCIEWPLRQCSSHGDTADQGIGAKGETGNGAGPCLDLLQQGRTPQCQAGAAEADGLAVHVMLAVTTGGQREAAAPVSLSGQA